MAEPTETAEKTEKPVKAEKAEKVEKAEKPEPKPRASSKKPAAQVDVWATGRRKSSVARVRVRRGDGKFLVNRRPHGEYFVLLQDRNQVEGALNLVGARQKVDVVVTVKGGGPTGQAGAVTMGLARALRKLDATYGEPLRLSGLLTRDSRMKERKKYGRRGARRGFQFSKR